MGINYNGNWYKRISITESLQYAPNVRPRVCLSGLISFPLWLIWELDCHQHDQLWPGNNLWPTVTRCDQVWPVYKVKRERSEQHTAGGLWHTKCDQFYYEGAKRPFGCKRSKPSRQDHAPQSNSEVERGPTVSYNMEVECGITHILAKWDCFGWNTQFWPNDCFGQWIYSWSITCCLRGHVHMTFSKFLGLWTPPYPCQYQFSAPSLPLIRNCTNTFPKNMFGTTHKWHHAHFWGFGTPSLLCHVFMQPIGTSCHTLGKPPP